MATLASAGLAGLQQFLAPSPEGTDPSRSAAPVDERLRLLAALDPLIRDLIDGIAAEVASSPVRAVLLALATEDLARTMGRAQIVAAGKIEESDAHTLKEEVLARVHEVHGNLAGFIEGTLVLPADDCNSPGTKMLFKDATDLLKKQLHLSFAASKQRLDTRDLLLPRAGFNGATIPPRFGVLSTVFNAGTADPQQVALAARRLLAMEPGIGCQEHPAESARLIEEQVAESLVFRDATGTDRLLKGIAARLDTEALERSEARMDAHLGLTFKGRQARGFIWELCTDILGHETLCGLADQVANPRSPFGSTGDRSPEPATAPGTVEPPRLPGFPDDEHSPDAPLIPVWAIDPDIPEDLRPRAAFTDLGQAGPGVGMAPGLQLLPGETAADAQQRAKARALHQFVFDAMRGVADGGPGAFPGLPLKPNTDLVVTISWDSLVGKLNDPGITQRNHAVSAGYARRLACSANAIPAVLGTKSEPLDLGRKQRFFSRAQRRAMLLRDKGCINPGCSMAAHRCEANHITPWYLGGKTDLANGALLCSLCHASFHAGHFGIVVVDAVPYVLQSKVLDPEQRLRRNWVFHPEATAID